MASKRRGGFGPPELRGTLGTLLRTTTDVVRGALERGAREGRSRLDDVRTNRRRQDALAELGEVVLDLIRRGEIDLEELPEARDLVRQLDDYDDAGGDADAQPRPSARRRFDDRDAGAGRVEADRIAPARGADHDRDADHDRGGHMHGQGHELGSGFEPPRRGSAPPGRDGRGSDVPRRPAGDVPRRRPDRSDGTVASGAALRSTKPTTPASPRAATDTSRAPTKPIKGIWRADPDAPGPDDAASPSRRYQLAPDPHRKGGISFEDDNDLADYMHPDDVPPRDTPIGDDTLATTGTPRAPGRDVDDHDH